MKRREIALVLWVAFIAIFIIRAFSFAAELDEVQFAIQSKGASWIAGETSVSKLSPEERKKLTGLILPTYADKEPVLGVLADQVAALPTSLDWRNNGGNYVTAIKDQGNCGSCWAFAANAALESVTLISQGKPNIDLNLAEQILVSCSPAGDCGGGYIDYASDFIRDTGVPLEDCYPYTATNGDCAKACPNWKASTMILS